MTDQQALRQQLKKIRLALSTKERAEAAGAAVQQVLKHPRYRRAKRVAAYFGSKGELCPMALIQHATALRKECYLPVLHPFRAGQLWFCRWRPGDPLTNNRFGIPEPQPDPDKLLAARKLDLVIVPLLGFDSDCHRLGMGGGYYDRSFAFTRRLNYIRHPFLLGFAHESQRVDRLPTQPWDITLNAVVTEHKLYSAQH